MWEIFLFKNDAENDEERLVSDHFVCVLNEFIWVKNKFSAPYFQYISMALHLDIQWKQTM